MVIKKWKYRAAAFLILCLSMLPSFTVLGESEAAPDGPNSQAKAAAVMDLDTGDLIYGEAENERLYPGGLAKLMTVLILSENYDLTEKVSFSEILYDLEEDSLRLPLQPGEEITLYDAACAIMLGSANDVANGVAEYVAGSPEAFAARMNDRAAELGCQNTHFTNPNGLYSEEFYTCAYDLALISRAAYENETVREICGLTEYTIPPTNLTESPRQLSNYHQMLQEGSGYYQEWCRGGKSSYTSQGLNSIVTFASNGKKNLVAVVMNVPEADAAYGETIDLLFYGFGDVPEPPTENTPLTEEALLPTEDLLQATEGAGENAEENTEEDTEENTEKITEEHTGENTEGNTEENTEADIGGGTGSGTEGITENNTKTEQKPENSIDLMLNQLEKYWNEGRSAASEYAKNHFSQVFALGCLFMLFLLLLILVLLRRSIRRSRSRRERKKAEQVWKEKESVIDNMSVEELEAELRKRDRLNQAMLGDEAQEDASDGINPASYPRGDE